MSSSPTSPFTMLGAADAAACEGDSCLLPAAAAASEAPGAAAAAAPDTGRDSESPDIEPDPDEAAAASSRAVIAALDEGASL